jgi:hypothetical protein
VGVEEEEEEEEEEARVLGNWPDFRMKQPPVCWGVRADTGHIYIYSLRAEAAHTYASQSMSPLVQQTEGGCAILSV